MIQYLFFCVWFISFNIMSSRFIHVATCVRISFLFNGQSNIPLYRYSAFCLSVDPSINIWVFFTFWLIVNNAAMNIGIHLFMILFNSFGFVPRSGIVNHMAILCLAFCCEELLHCFPINEATTSIALKSSPILCSHQQHWMNIQSCVIFPTYTQEGLRNREGKGLTGGREILPRKST